jgi:hypothetical protein
MSSGVAKLTKHPLIAAATAWNPDNDRIAIIQRAVALHGGTFSISSTVGGGMTITVTLPAE